MACPSSTITCTTCETTKATLRNVNSGEFAENPLTAGLKMVVFYGVHSVQAGSGTALIWLRPEHLFLPDRPKRHVHAAGPERKRTGAGRR